MEVVRLLSLLRRWWWLFLLGIIIGGGSAYAVSQLMTPVYRASATLLVNQTQTPGVIAYNDILTSERLTQTYRELITKRPVLEQVVDDTGVALTSDELAGAVDVDVVEDTQLLRLSVEDSIPYQARMLANAIASTFIETNEAEELSRSGTVSIVESARTPASPVRPRTMLNSVMGALVGLVLAIGFALLYEHLDNTVKTSEDVEAACGLPTLGGVTRFPRTKAATESLVVASSNRTAAAEAYRVLRANLQFSTFDAQSLLVSSASPREGKTTTTANLAAAIAQTGQRVVVVDSDLRRPALHKVFGLGNGAGLTNALLAAEPEPERFLQPTRHENLWLLASGPVPPNPSELLSSTRMETVVAELRKVADLVLFDSPPLLAVADASILAAKVDATILVVDAGRTRAPALQRAAQAVGHAKARVMGAILNKLAQSGHGYYSYHYYYSSHSDDGDRGGDGDAGAPRRRWLPWGRQVAASQKSETHA